MALSSGAFTMGGDILALADMPAQPSITVHAFSLDAYEVTVARFRRFWRAGHPAAMSALMYPGGLVPWTGGAVTEPMTTGTAGCTWSESVATPSLEAHPINCVDWTTAQAFCVWDGGRLPTEAEWEYAARGSSLGGLTPERIFPWGDNPPSPTCDLAQGNSCPGDDGTSTKRVGSFAPSAGLYDLAGNVWEWTADLYAPYTDTSCWDGEPRTDPVCTTPTPDLRSLRGGSWRSDDIAYVRASSRKYDTPATRSAVVGFRCARPR